MAKAKNIPPSIEAPSNSEAEELRQELQEEQEKFSSPTVITHDLSFPVCEPVKDATHRFGAITVKGLKIQHRRALVRLREGLDKSNATLANGQPIKDNTNALRWLLEAIAASAGIE